MNIEDKFNKMVQTNKHVFLSKDKEIIEYLKERKKKIKGNNKLKKIHPWCDKNYWCLTCGSKSGLENPETAYCYYCDTDNWEPHKNKTI